MSAETAPSPSKKLAELADFYNVPVSELLPDAAPAPAAEPPPRLVLDLERLGQVPAERPGHFARYAAAIQAQRGDYNGRILSIRQDDLRTLAVIYDESPAFSPNSFIAWACSIQKPEGQ